MRFCLTLPEIITLLSQLCPHIALSFCQPSVVSDSGFINGFVLNQDKHLGREEEKKMEEEEGLIISSTLPALFLMNSEAHEPFFNFM